MKVAIRTSAGGIFHAEIGDGDMSDHDCINATWDLLNTGEPIEGRWEHGDNRFVVVRFNPTHVVQVAA